MKASALLLLLLPFASNAAAPTAPDEADAGSIPVTAPVNVKSESLKLSPEQLVVASMPWVFSPFDEFLFFFLSCYFLVSSSSFFMCGREG